MPSHDFNHGPSAVRHQDIPLLHFDNHGCAGLYIIRGTRAVDKEGAAEQAGVEEKRFFSPPLLHWKTFHSAVHTSTAFPRPTVPSPLDDRKKSKDLTIADCENVNGNRIVSLPLHRYARPSASLPKLEPEKCGEPTISIRVPSSKILTRRSKERIAGLSCRYVRDARASPLSGPTNPLSNLMSSQDIDKKGDLAKLRNTSSLRPVIWHRVL